MEEQRLVRVFSPLLEEEVVVPAIAVASFREPVVISPDSVNIHVSSLCRASSTVAPCSSRIVKGNILFFVTLSPDLFIPETIDM